MCEMFSWLTAVRSAKFIARKQWIVAGADDMFIRVYNYNTMDKVKQFEAHTDYIRSVAVHPTLPYVLSSSDDMLIKLWDWEKGWTCVQIFEGHSHYVMQVSFNPKDNNTFASASLDRTIKVIHTEVLKSFGLQCVWNLLKYIFSRNPITSSLDTSIHRICCFPHIQKYVESGFLFGVVADLELGLPRSKLYSGSSSEGCQLCGVFQWWWPTLSYHWLRWPDGQGNQEH